MFIPINDCGKQLTINSTVREKDCDDTKLYRIIEIEFDQYKLELLHRNSIPEPGKLFQVLTCEQLVQFHFEVDDIASSHQ